jgi:hypothetical protein
VLVMLKRDRPLLIVELRDLDGNVVGQKRFPITLELLHGGAETSLEAQMRDEGNIGIIGGTKGVEVYRDWAYSLGIRRPGWG